MRKFCFTVDLDRDVNIPIPGTSVAGSMDRGNGTAPRFESTAKGTELLVEMLDSLGIKCTFFAEARSLMNSGASSFVDGHEVAMHGLDHEDYSGEKTDFMMDYGEMRDTVERAISIIRDCTGTQPKGFRSPYMMPNEDMLEFLNEYGIKYDSSYYHYIEEQMSPYRLDCGLMEIPVPKFNDVCGKPITSYLNPLHEGSRKPDDFIRLKDVMKDGVFIVATHSWHICETMKGKLDLEHIRKNIEGVQSVIESFIDSGYVPVTMLESLL